MAGRPSIAALLLCAAVAAGATELPNLEHLPSARPYASGMRDFQSERYFSARYNFQLAAHWGDKVAQFNLGVIHYHGHGVPADRPRAWAWFQLAAERDYPQLVEMADLVWDELGDDARDTARAVYAELAEEFGDAVALPRAARYMELEERRMTGSRVGAIGNLTVITGDGRTRSGEDFYRREDRDVQTIVARETALFHRLNTGRVEIGELEVIKDDK